MKATDLNAIIDERLNHPDHPILKKIQERTWTSHNIPLTQSESTLGQGIPLIGDDTRTRVIKKNLATFLTSGSDLSGLRIIDLGCLEGGLSFEMSREGMEVLGVEGRLSNFQKCELIKSYFDLPNLEFLHLDVKDLNRKDHGVFDAVLCCGLLYHLDEPLPFLRQLNEITHDASVLFLDTHVAPRESELSKCLDSHRLSPMVTLHHEGDTFEGRWYSEYSKDQDGTDEEWAAVSNCRSFWLSHDSLIRAVYKSGFKRIYNIHGAFEIDLELELRAKHSRLHFVALKNDYMPTLEHQ